MKARSREVVKALIELSPNVEEADNVINENYNLKNIDEKIAFLKGMFADVISEEKSAEMDYWSMLNAIIIN